MVKRAKTVGVLFFLLIVLAACNGNILAMFGNEKIKDALNGPLEDFQVIDQHGEPFSKKDLEGKVWVANLIFTNCRTVCPPMTSNMAEIQRLLKEEGLDTVHLVSFSVDPEVDTPEKLTEFASRFTDDTENWHFLTGYVQKFIEQFARNNFHTIVEKPENEDQVTHGTSFYLINQEGIIVKDYPGVFDVPYEEIIGDIKILLKKK